MDALDDNSQSSRLLSEAARVGLIVPPLVDIAPILTPFAVSGWASALFHRIGDPESDRLSH